MKIFNILFLLFISLTGYSQAEPVFTIFSNNFSFFNPGYTGVNFKHYGSINARNTWIGIEDSPYTFTGIYEAKAEELGGGIGVGYIYDKDGLGISHRIYLNYSFHSNIDIGTLSYGISNIYDQKTIDNTQLNSTTGNFSLISQTEGQGKIHLNLGVCLKTEKFEIGISSTQINEPTYEKLSYTAVRQYYLISAYNFDLSKNIQLKSTFLFKTDMRAMRLDFNNILLYKKNIWFGLCYYNNSHLEIQGGINLFEKYRIGYAFDYPFNKVVGFGLTSHEFIIAIMIN